MRRQYTSNKDIAEALSGVAAYLEMEGTSFRSRAFRNASGTVFESGREIALIYKEGGLAALEELPGIGKSIAKDIEEMLTTGHFTYYESLKKKTPVDVISLTAIEGLGAKSVAVLYKELGVRNVRDLERAARKGRIRVIPGFGAKSEENILKGIEFMKRYEGRQVTGLAMPGIQELKRIMGSAPGARRVEIAGSVRRRKETIGDIDILVVSEDPSKTTEFFVSLADVEKVYAKGRTKSSVKLSSGLDADLRIVPAESWGAALNYFTGSKAHNVALRKIAIKKGYKLNEYGVFKRKGKGWEYLAGKDEKDVYRALGLPYIEPELREMTGEIEAASEGRLPKLIGYSDVKGDLQVQTEWTDGSGSIMDMAMQAIGMGLEYIAITDHTKHLAMTGGLDEQRLADQGREIAKVNGKLRDTHPHFTILAGTECDILKDGSLDLKDSALKKLDIAGVAVHSHFNLPEKEQTARIIKAMQNPYVDILFHPTGRILGRREAYKVNMEKIIDAALETGTVLEIDAYPDRLDLKDDHIRMAVGKGVRLVIDSDAHAPEHMKFLEWGIAQARRGWASKRDVVNTRPLSKALGFFKRNRS